MLRHLFLLLLGFAAGRAQTVEIVVPPLPGKPPTIDGVFREGEWNGAVTIDDLRQTEPNEGARATERTVVHLLVGPDALYVGFQCHDGDPAGIIGRLVKRDTSLAPDDHVEFILDTFHDRRNAYYFQISPGGARGDALVARNGDFFNKSWDGIWEARSTVHAGGWSAEFSIPAKTLAMSDRHERFGFNVARIIKRKRETVQWATPNRRNPLLKVSAAGSLVGMDVLRKGVGIDVTPYTSLRWRSDGGLGIEPGFDVRYRITPSLTATITVNTDFAEAEVDERIINLTRFPVSLPEKREFFLEDSGFFSMTTFGGGLMPFFSRRIGLSPSGDPLRILGGAKVVGRTGDFGVGVLSLVTEGNRSVDTESLSAMRVTKDLWEESQVGLLGTFGDPSSQGRNAVLGLDFTWRTSSFLDDRNLRLDVFSIASLDEETDGSEEFGYAYGVRLSYPNDLLEAEIGYREVADDFRPDLGFVSRRGVRRVFGEIEFNPRPGGDVRRMSFGLDALGEFSLADGDVTSASLGLKLIEIELESGDELELRLDSDVENPRSSFEVSEGIEIAAGKYRFERFRASLDTSTKRAFGLELDYSYGGFFGGIRQGWSVGVVWRPAAGLDFEIEFERNRVDLPGGSFKTHQVVFRADVGFGPDVAWSTLIQFDDVSDSIGINTRLRWIVRPEAELFLIANLGLLTRDENDSFTLRNAGTDLSFKLQVTIRF